VGGAGEAKGGRGSLTPANRFAIDYLGVSPGLSDYVTTFYHFRCDDEKVNDIQPAAIGHLSLFPLGEGEMGLPEGGIDPSHRVNLLTPFSRAAPFRVDGPFHAIGAALSPLGWAALTGLCAKTHGNRLYRADDWLDPALVALGNTLCAAYRAGEKDARQCVAELEPAMLAAMQPLKTGHPELIAATNAWLAGDFLPEIDDLYAASPYSRRQTQRLVERHFGLSPVALRRKYRALRAATLLSLPSLTLEYEAQIGEAFYDQPHMIREIRLFAGRTPARLGDTSSPYLTEMLNKKNLRQVGLPLELDDDANDSQESKMA
jgi:AraC-like DNA-binding protein